MRIAMAGLLIVELLCGADVFYFNNPHGFSLATDLKDMFDEENAVNDLLDQEKPAKKLDAEALRRIQMREKRRFARLETAFKRFQLAAYLLIACLASIGIWLLLAAAGRQGPSPGEKAGDGEFSHGRKRFRLRRIVTSGLIGAILAGCILTGLFGVAFILSGAAARTWDRLDWETCWLMGTVSGGISGSVFAMIALAIDKLAHRAHSQKA